MQEITAFHPDRAPARKGKHARGHDSNKRSGPSKKPRMERAPVVAEARNELMADTSIWGYADDPKDGKRYYRALAIYSRRKTGASAVGSQGIGLEIALALMFQVEPRKSLLAWDSHTSFCAKNIGCQPPAVGGIHASSPRLMQSVEAAMLICDEPGLDSAKCYDGDLSPNLRLRWTQRFSRT